MKKRPHFFVPANFDPVAVMDANHVQRDRARVQDLYYYVLGTMTRITNSFRSGLDDLGNPIVPRLYSVLLQKAMGSNYTQYLRHLVYSGVIDRVECGFKGSTCHEFHLLEPYRGAPLREVAITNHSLIKQARAVQEILERQDRVSLGPMAFLTTWMNPKRLKIDAASAFSWVDEYQCLISEKIQSSGIRAGVRRELLHGAQRAADSMRLRISDIDAGLLKRMKPDDFGYRIHSPLTNLKSELRHFLTFDGCPLSSPDVSNAQPYFLSTVLEGLTFDGLRKEERCEVVRWMREGTGVKEGRDVYSESLMLYDYDETHTGSALQRIPSDEITRFRELLGSGTFYEHLQELLSGQFFFNGFDRFGSRSLMKTGTLWLMYNDPKQRRYAPAEYYAPLEVFAAAFPTVFAIMERLKYDDYTASQ